MTVEELKLIAKYAEQTDEERNVFTDISTFMKYAIGPKLNMDENNGNVSYSVSLQEISDNNMSTEDFYKMCEHGWQLVDNNLVLNI